MTTRRRRRIPWDSSARGEWEAEREEQIDGARRTGLGLRPFGWWLYESRRPDLAASPGHDVYVHLREESGPHMAAAVGRLRFLIDSGELTADEAAAIRRGATGEREPGRWAWRLAILDEVAP